MSEISERKTIALLQHKWNRQIFISYILVAASIVFFISAITLKLFHNYWIPASFIIVISSLVVFLWQKKKISEQDVVDFLNQSDARYQESAHLMMRPFAGLNELEKIQLIKTEHLLQSNSATPPLIKRRMKTSLLLFAIAVLVFIFLLAFPVAINHPELQNSSSFITAHGNKPEVKPVGIKDVSITITPPAYTHKAARKQTLFNIVAEQNAKIKWEIQTTDKAKQIQLLFSDKSQLSLHSINETGTHWATGKTVTKTGFYQVVTDDKPSDLYQMEMIKDEPPSIVLQSPKPNTLIPAGKEKKTLINVSLSDDYGIESACINATTASGSGEAVTFKQMQIPFADFKKGGEKFDLQQQLNLSSLHMTGGDELYFYITATDNNNQQKRSDVYVVRLEEPAELMSMAGLMNGLDIKPELFRSERQIIIETEQLLKEKDTISEEKFKERSNNLGTDQQLLRLRYGKYLGEETESEIGVEQGEEEYNDVAGFGNAEKVIDQYSDKHDVAEDAGFFDASTKKQLQKMLTEMWKASLQLKTYKPKDALPFAYNALRLLKDLQQKTRAYVAKTGVQTAPLQTDKRLTGELDKIVQPVVKYNQMQTDSALPAMRKALGVLERLKNREAISKPEMNLLREAENKLGASASLQPSVYLISFQSLKKIMANKYTESDITIASKGLQKMIKPVSAIAESSVTAPDMNLSHRYFMNVNRRYE